MKRFLILLALVLPLGVALAKSAKAKSRPVKKEAPTTEQIDSDVINRANAKVIEGASDILYKAFTPFQMLFPSNWVSEK